MLSDVCRSRTGRRQIRALACVVGASALATALTSAAGFSSFSATSRAGSGAFAAAAVFPPRNTARPTIAGSPQNGTTLTGATGAWARSPASHAWQWQRCDAQGAQCAVITGATASTYTVQPEDVRRTLRLEVTATNAGGSADAVSETTGPVAGLAAPVNTEGPAISGAGQVGSPLSTSHGTWKGIVTAYGYQWLRCATAAACVPIEGATVATYTPAPADAGATVRVRVMASNAGGSTAAVSAATPGVQGRPVNVGAPVMTGIAAVGQPLTASSGLWTGAAPIAYAYAWSRCDAAGEACVPIAGAEAAAYTATAADLGHRLTARVAASNVAGAASAPAAPSSAIATAYDGRVLAAGPTAYYTFEGVTTTVADATGHGYTGSFTNPGTASGAIAGSSTAANFAGGYIALPANIMSGSAGFTWEGWVSEDCCVGRVWQRVFDFGAGPGQTFWLTTDYGGGPGWLAAVSSAATGFSVVAPWQGLGRWVHVTMTSERGGTRLYLDGALAAASAGGLAPSDLPDDSMNWLGRSAVPVDPLFAGRMDDVAVYNRALSASEVAAHYAAR